MGFFASLANQINVLSELPKPFFEDLSPIEISSKSDQQLLKFSGEKRRETGEKAERNHHLSKASSKRTAATPRKMNTYQLTDAIFAVARTELANQYDAITTGRKFPKQY